MRIETAGPTLGTITDYLIISADKPATSASKQPTARKESAKSESPL